VNYCTTKNRSPLFRAAKRDHYDVVLHLIGCGADVNIRDNEKESALSHAIQKGHVKIAQELRNKGAKDD
jgi:ankyrin repeat protein